MEGPVLYNEEDANVSFEFNDSQSDSEDSSSTSKVGNKDN